METRTIYKYTDFRTFLRVHAEEKRKISPHWSLGVWTKQLGFTSTAVLTNILNGKRNPGKNLEQKFLNYFKFNGNEKAYFQDLIRLKKVSYDPRLSVALMEKMGKSNPNGSFELLDDRTFSTISKWFYYAIREMIQLRHFKEDILWIQKNLEFKVTTKEIKKAITDLLELGLIYRDQTGRLKTAQKTIKTSDNIASEGIKRFHEQMLENSKVALKDIDILERDITGRTFNIDEKNLPKLKQFIREFRDKACELFEESPGTRTYQLNIQLLPLTKKHNGGTNYEK